MIQFKGRFFQKVWCISLIAPKMCPKLSWKRFSNCVLFRVSWLQLHCSVGERENSKYKAYDKMQHTFWEMEIIPIFFREYRTFNKTKILETGKSCNDKVSAFGQTKLRIMRLPYQGWHILKTSIKLCLKSCDKQLILSVEIWMP